MKPKLLVILDLAINEGVKRGWHLAHKHVETPHENAIKSHIEDAVMASLYEYFTFEDSDHD